MELVQLFVEKFKELFPGEEIILALIDLNNIIFANSNLVTLIYMF